MTDASPDALGSEVVGGIAREHRLQEASARSNIRSFRQVFYPNGMHYQEALRSLIAQRAVKRYLEIGVQAGVLLSQIEVDVAIGVDPDFQLSADPTRGKKSLHLHRMTSDEFFAQHNTDPVDFAFLDGMHKVEYLLRDFYNAEACCHANSLIVMHDCLSFDESLLTRVPNDNSWTGDVWKIVPILERYRPDLRVVLLDAAPNGLVCVTNLDPSSRILRSRYLEIIDMTLSEPNNNQALERFYDGRVVHSTAAVLGDSEQSRYFVS